MLPKIGRRYLITTDNWFMAPDGEMYKAVFGTINAILNDEATLGIKTNSKSTNWYVSIGNMLIAGCQVHYCIATDKVSLIPGTREIEHDGKLHAVVEVKTRIYIAD